jgi:CheY-like chemotaxis protein
VSDVAAIAERRRSIVQAVLAGRRPLRRASADATAPDGREQLALEPAAVGRRTARSVRVFLLLGTIGPEASRVSRALARTGRVVVVGASSEPLEGIEHATAVRPEVIVVDRFVGLVDGFAVTRRLHSDLPDRGIVLRTPWPEADRHEARRAGAHATVDAAATTDELVAAICAAAGPLARR